MKGKKLDLIKLFKPEYTATENPKIITVEKAMYLVVDGCGAPASDSFQNAVAGLYSMAYTMKMTRKSEGKGDYTIGKLEGIYWNEDGSELDSDSMDQWSWRLMIRTPEIVDGFPLTNEDLVATRTRLIEKKKGSGTESVTLDFLHEGQCVQMLHVGPYEEEKQSLARLMEYCELKQLTPRGRHHEIYISDPRRTAPEKLKTIIRLPVS